MKIQLNLQHVDFSSSMKKKDLKECLLVTLEKCRPVVCTLKELLEKIAIGKKGTSKGPKKSTVDDVMSDFTPSAYWQELKPLKFGVTGPISTIPNTHVPTIQSVVTTMWQSIWVRIP